MTTQPHIRPRRSALYMPASNARALEKARTLAADVLILDLEDAVAPDAKEAARTQAVNALAEGGFGRRELILRVNALSSRWGRADLEAARLSMANGIALPKVESAKDVHAALEILGDGPQMLWCMIETPKGVMKADEIAASSTRLAGLILGTSDLAKDLRSAHTADRLPLLYSLSRVLLAARANGLACLDGVHLDLEDDAGFERACAQGREMGFDGKTLIHPKTIETANRIFAPSAEEVAKAQKIVAAFEAARAEGKGVVVVDGRLVEALHVEEAKRLLALAAAIGSGD